MRFKDLYYLLALVKNKSINNASKEVNVTRQALAAVIDNLEEELGVKIFERSYHGLKLTKEGEVISRYAQKFLDDYQEMISIISKETNHTITGEVNIYSQFVYSMSVLPKIIRDIKKKYPNIKINNYTFERNEIIERICNDVEKSKASIGVVSVDIDNKKEFLQRLKENNEQFFPIREMEMCFFVSKNHPLAKQKMVSIRTILSFPLVRFSNGQEKEINQFKDIGSYTANMNVNTFGVWCEILKNSNKVGFLYDIVLNAASNFQSNIDDIVIIRSYEKKLAEIGYVLPLKPKKIIEKSVIEILNNNLK